METDKENISKEKTLTYGTKVIGMSLRPPPTLKSGKAKIISINKKMKEINVEDVYGVYGHPFDFHFYTAIVKTYVCPGEGCRKNIKYAIPVDKGSFDHWFEKKELVCPSCDIKMRLTEELGKEVEAIALGFKNGTVKPDFEVSREFYGGY